MEKYIVVRVCKNGGGNTSSVLTEKDAITHFNNWSDVGNAPNNLFVKVFDTNGQEYKVLKRTFGEGCFLHGLDNGWDF